MQTERQEILTSIEALLQAHESEWDQDKMRADPEGFARALVLVSGALAGDLESLVQDDAVIARLRKYMDDSASAAFGFGAADVTELEGMITDDDAQQVLLVIAEQRRLLSNVAQGEVAK